MKKIDMKMMMERMVLNSPPQSYGVVWEGIQPPMRRIYKLAVSERSDTAAIIFTMSLETSVYDEAQAALLNSECEPREAVKMSLRAALRFAQAEDILAPDRELTAWLQLAREVWEDIVLEDSRHG